MVDVMIERWSAPGGKTDFLWSVWRDGKRVHMGGTCPSADDAETDARLYCRQRLGQEPDAVTRL